MKKKISNLEAAKEFENDSYIITLIEVEGLTMGSVEWIYTLWEKKRSNAVMINSAPSRKRLSSFEEAVEAIKRKERATICLWRDRIYDLEEEIAAYKKSIDEASKNVMKLWNVA